MNEMKGVCQFSILIAMVVYYCTFAMADQPLHMNELNQVHRKSEQDAEVTKFILKMLEEGSEQSFANQCDDFVTKLVGDFTHEIKEKIKCKLGGSCETAEPVLLDIENGPASLKALFTLADDDSENDNGNTEATLGKK